MRAWRRIARRTGTGADGDLGELALGRSWCFGKVGVGRSWCWDEVGVGGKLVLRESWCWGELAFWCGRVLDILASRGFDSGYIFSVCDVGEGGGKGERVLDIPAGEQRSSEKNGKWEKGNSYGWSLARSYILNGKGGGVGVGWGSPKGPCLRDVLLRLSLPWEVCSSVVWPTEAGGCLSARVQRTHSDGLLSLLTWSGYSVLHHHYSLLGGEGGVGEQMVSLVDLGKNMKGINGVCSGSPVVPVPVYFISMKSDAAGWDFHAPTAAACTTGHKSGQWDNRTPRLSMI